jgi:hypothetical protein
MSTPRGSSSQDYMSVQTIVPGTGGITQIGALRGHRDVTTATPYTGTGAVGSWAILHSMITNTGAGGDIVLTLPTATVLLAELTAEKVSMPVGTAFTFLVQALANHSITIAASASITFKNGQNNIVVAAHKSGTFTVYKTSATAFTVTYIISA